MQRVKVYRLNSDGLWDDKGTGHVSVEYLEVRLLLLCSFADAACYTAGTSFRKHFNALPALLCVGFKYVAPVRARRTKTSDDLYVIKSWLPGMPPRAQGPV